MMPPRPFDTSTLGPIRVDPNRNAIRASVMREALEQVGELAGREGRVAVGCAFATIAMTAHDEDLVRLHRLLHHSAPTA